MLSFGVKTIPYLHISSYSKPIHKKFIQMLYNDKLKSNYTIANNGNDKIDELETSIDVIT